MSAGGSSGSSDLKQEADAELGSFSTEEKTEAFSSGDGSSASGTTTSSSSSSSSSKSCCSGFVSCIKALPLGPLMIAIRVLNVLLALGLLAVYPVAFLTAWEEIRDDGAVFTNVMLMVYCTTFSIMLLVFEARVAQMDKRMNHLFGFMFSFLGRAMFMCFLGTLAFAGTWVVNLVVGGVAIAFAIVQCVIMYNHPAFQPDGEMSNRSSRHQGSYSSVDQESLGADTGPQISMTRHMEPLPRDDFEGDIGDDPFHVSKGVMHYDEDDDEDGAQPGDVSITISRDDEPGADVHSPGVSSRAVTTATVASSSSEELDPDAMNHLDDSTDDSDMENPFAE